MDNDIEQLREHLKQNREDLGGYGAFAMSAGLSKSWLYKFVEGVIEEPRRANLNKVRSALGLDSKRDASSPAAEADLSAK